MKHATERVESDLEQSLNSDMKISPKKSNQISESFMMQVVVAVNNSNDNV